MTIPFADLFKKLTARFAAAPATAAPAQVRPVHVKKPSDQQLRKTVLPHSTRSFRPPDPFHAAAGSQISTKATPSFQLGARKITSGAAGAASRSRDLPPALALALEPKLERAISLQLSDFLDQVPAGYVKPVEILDASVRVSLKASEIEKGMPEGKPSIALPSLYQQVPEIFLRSVPPADQTRVALPYAKVLEQFNSARVRDDQVRDPAVGQVDTPILQATIEDTERFGTKMEPLQSSVLPPVHIEPATAENIAAAEPEPAAQETIRSAAPGLTKPAHPVISLHSPDLKPKSEPPLPTRIPFHLPPNGTGVPASERVPASCGPPVPTALPLLPEQAHIPFQPPVKHVDPKVSAPAPATATGEFLADPELAPRAPAKSAPAVSLALKPLLRNVPAFQLKGDAATVLEDARVEFPLSLIEPQLASGRVTVSPQVFQAAIPEKYRDLVRPDEADTPIVLPLEEVLKSLPATILKLRDDQEEMVADKDFDTPFSIKAKEDAQRFQASAQSVPEIAAKPTDPSVVKEKIDIAAEKKMDAKEVIARASAFPGVKACAVTFSDGLSLAGNLPPEIAADGLCAMAPSLLQKIGKHMLESKLGSLVAVTLHCATSAVSFFAKGNICLTALHGGEALTRETRAQLGELTEKLSRTYAQSETPHVDH